MLTTQISLTLSLSPHSLIVLGRSSRLHSVSVLLQHFSQSYVLVLFFKLIKSIIYDRKSKILCSNIFIWTWNPIEIYAKTYEIVSAHILRHWEFQRILRTFKWLKWHHISKFSDNLHLLIHFNVDSLSVYPINFIYDTDILWEKSSYLTGYMFIWDSPNLA